MGVVDIVILHEIYKKLLELEKEHNWGFNFKTDDGNFETAIIFNEETKSSRRPGPGETWNDIKYPETLICPDISDYDHKILFEYEEETGNRRSGAYLAKKGHGHMGDLPTKRDSSRNQHYRNSKFRFCRIWELEFKNMDDKLFHFLADCFCNRDTTKYEN